MGVDVEPERRVGDVLQYSNVMALVAQKNGIPFVDSYAELIHIAGGSEANVLRTFLRHVNECRLVC